MKLIRLAGLIPLLYITSVIAIEPFVVKDIRVEGIQRTEPGTVFSYLPVKVGDTLNDEQSVAALRALFATGFFTDVRLKADQGVLVVIVRERPSIASVEINGVKDIPKETLSENLKFVGLAEGRIFDKAALEKSENELKRAYVARGRYAVSVKTTVTELERNRVSVTFDVVEGDKSRIRQINIVGNQVFSEKELLEMMKLTTPTMWTWMSSNDQYSKQKLSADLEVIRSFYLDGGYLEFLIDSTQVSISPDKKDIYITINVTEGAKYTVSDIKLLAPETILPHAEMRKLIMLQAGDVFSRSKLTESQKNVSDRLGDDGYAFANVSAVPELDKVKHEVAFTFVADPGQRVYVRHINVLGNTKTRDEVVRREFRQMEGAWFATKKIQKSKQRVDRLDFFSEVNLETPPVQSTKDQVDLNISVKEKPTGSFNVGAGISSSQGLVLTAGITQSNLFGTGKQLSTQVNTSQSNQVYSISYTNPYYTDDGVSRGFDLYQRNLDTTTTSISPYKSYTSGGGVRFGLPIGEDETMHYGLSVEQSTYELTTSSPTQFLTYVSTFGSTTSNLLGTVGWTRDSRNSAIYPTEGKVQRAFMEVTLPASDQRYYKLTYQHQKFIPLSQDFTWLLNGEAGVAGGYGDKPLPFFKNFYAGGVGSVRGYEPNSIGPRDSLGAYLGGDRRALLNTELLFPMPGSKDKSVRLSGFVDGGIIYGVPTEIPGSDGPRYSTGFALTWVSPIGPLKLSYAWPLQEQAGDKLQRFQFTLGQIF
ncbi:MAG: outer membrane protein assembly factor BamA [Gallionellales bacterium 35-53-114]|jgi:outer membrane protein insertion porin family|nr:MAG: outer membrane protein assembly factor BamA [Gallionellales bacterium 35-53-114]OYZ65375.1 MAG: outer membrane protein assembly factor BamA [Gallionellales bacterium 24-53-125]OZB08282.1 MAG: outer membrane protein assembly factor BamA [Gallionellales bacterium 39-52-133]HQS58218.1 outer membrane protein assembly factor BamA [Gallionellaceae bacterium]HQS73773.1 outer membrane protein assembly factor BamA [Gallionellaceae bacterium]